MAKKETFLVINRSGFIGHSRPAKSSGINDNQEPPLYPSGVKIDEKKTTPEDENILTHQVQKNKEEDDFGNILTYLP